MRNFWMGVVLAPLVLSMAASEAAQEPEVQTFQPLSSRAIYLGRVLDDGALGQRALEQNAASGAIEVYNVWTSFQEPQIKSNLSLKGHAYQICGDQYNSFFFASLDLQLRKFHRRRGNLQSLQSAKTVDHLFLRCQSPWLVAAHV